jgi:hypothetical protein
MCNLPLSKYTAVVMFEFVLNACLKWSCSTWDSLPWEDVKANTREEKHAKIKEMKMDMCAEVLTCIRSLEKHV